MLIAEACRDNAAISDYCTKNTVAAHHRGSYRASAVTSRKCAMMYSIRILCRGRPCFLPPFFKLFRSFSTSSNWKHCSLPWFFLRCTLKTSLQTKTGKVLTRQGAYKTTRKKCWENAVERMFHHKGCLKISRCPYHCRKIQRILSGLLVGNCIDPSPLQ